MMQNGGFKYSSDDLSDSEKLKELTAYVQGCVRLMSIGTKRLVSYQDFLLDEVESNSRAEDFLNRCQVLVGQLSALSSVLRSDDTIGEKGDCTGLQALLNGVIHRCRGLHSQENKRYELVCPSQMTILGDIPQLQQTFFQMLEALGDAEEITVVAQETQFNDIELHKMGSDCNSGDYVCIDFISGGAEEEVEYRSVGDLLASCVPMKLPLSDLMCWVGVLWRHDGEMMLGELPNGAPCIRLLLGREGGSQSTVQETLVGGNETILLVDDEDMIWDVVIDMLMNLGYTVVLASNGREAIEVYGGNPGGIDLVIMDMVMPEMNGREAFECLKKLDPNVKVLMSSGYVDEEDAHYVMEAGAKGFLRKPYKIADLAKKVRQLLDK